MLPTSSFSSEFLQRSGVELYAYLDGWSDSGVSPGAEALTALHARSGEFDAEHAIMFLLLIAQPWQTQLAHVFRSFLSHPDPNVRRTAFDCLRRAPSPTREDMEAVRRFEQSYGGNIADIVLDMHRKVV